MYRLICTLVVIAIALKESECQTVSDGCQELSSCNNTLQHGPGGTYSWTRLESRPTQAEWDTIRENICNTKASRVACIDAHMNTCDDENIKSEARTSKEKAYRMCQTDGREFLRRVYNEGGDCIGNHATRELINANRRACIATLMSNGFTCPNIETARNCDASFVSSTCSPLTSWVIHMGWLARYSRDHRFQFCESSAEPLPPLPAES